MVMINHKKFSYTMRDIKAGFNEPEKYYDTNGDEMIDSSDYTVAGWLLEYSELLEDCGVELKSIKKLDDPTEANFTVGVDDEGIIVGDGYDGVDYLGKYNRKEVLNFVTLFYDMPEDRGIVELL